MSKNKNAAAPLVTHISGLSSGQIAPVLSQRLSAEGECAGRPCLIVTSSSERASALAKTFSFFTNRNICTVSEDAPYFLGFDAKSRDELNDRVSALTALRTDREALVIAAASGALKKIAPPELWGAGKFEIVIPSTHPGSTSKTASLRHPGVVQELDIERIAELLFNIGYERVHMVGSRGEFSHRGDILDIWIPCDPKPVRVHFFGDEIEYITSFDADTQKSSGKIESVTVYPASELPVSPLSAAEAADRVCAEYEKTSQENATTADAVREKARVISEIMREGVNRQLLLNYITYFSFESANMSDYLPENGMVIFDDIGRIYEHMELREREAVSDFEIWLARGECISVDFESFAGVSDIPKLCAGRDTLLFTPDGIMPKKATEAFGEPEIELYEAKHPPLMGGHMPMLVSELKRYLKDNFEVTIVCSTEGRLENIRELLADEDLPGGVLIVPGELLSGIEITSEKKVWLWDGDIFKAGRSGGRRRKRFGKGAPVRSFTDIETGDYVVHESHGVGKYEGLQRLEVEGVVKEYLKIRYSGGDYLYVPTEQTTYIQKYIGGGDTKPRMNNLSGKDWKRAKAKVKADVAHMAAGLAALAAERRTLRGHAFAADGEWQAEFEDSFPYRETDDQLAAIASIKADMEKPEPMDRLLCGDVGYGKTEVALRAVFKCVSDGKQAAVLVPTTLLARQHHSTFVSRFGDFPFTVAMMSRFCSPAEQKKALEDTAKGRVDVLIGTHRILSSDVKFKDLGLLIVDEEHRFGVKHKEKIKKLKKDVDVLSMTATPIPRTLHMSLLGVRNMDTIEEPPEDRYPVQTYVMEERTEALRETIRREMDRQGQVFAVVSRISQIDRVMAEIRLAAPEARVAVGHGQMGEHVLEDTMADFIAGKYDVLISTTIIESGIDIPNANTVLIFDADRFGLSQLYQIRGRVGRTNRIAFAYLMYRRGKQLSEVAEKRLRTIKEFAEFGAGFKIAMQDLEIRGAGNLLGPQQHGHMAAVGYEMYCRMVSDAVRAISAGRGSDEVAAAIPPGEADGTEYEPPEITMNIGFSAYIPQSYIDSEPERLDVYQRIAMIENEEEMATLTAELDDRYGSVPYSVKGLMLVALAGTLAAAHGERSVNAQSMAELEGFIARYISESEEKMPI